MHVEPMFSCEIDKYESKTNKKRQSHLQKINALNKSLINRNEFSFRFYLKHYSLILLFGISNEKEIEKMQPYTNFNR